MVKVENPIPSRGELERVRKEGGKDCLLLSDGESKVGYREAPQFNISLLH